MLEIGDGDAELLPLLDGAVGPESLVFADDGDGDGGDGGPFTGVSDGSVLGAGGCRPSGGGPNIPPPRRTFRRCHVSTSRP